MRDQGLLKNCPWLHILGVSPPKVGVVLTLLQRELRKHTDAKHIQLTFDSKNPVDAVINGYRPMVVCDFDTSKWSIRFEKLDFNRASKDKRSLYELALDCKRNSASRFAPPTALGVRLKLRDLFSDVKGNQTLPDRFKQALLIRHNTQVYFECFRHMYGFLSEGQLHNRPRPMGEMQLYLETVFTSETHITVIDELEPQLSALIGE